MATNLAIDDRLIEEAKDLRQAPYKKAAVTFGWISEPLLHPDFTEMKDDCTFGKMDDRAVMIECSNLFITTVL